MKTKLFSLWLALLFLTLSPLKVWGEGYVNPLGGINSFTDLIYNVLANVQTLVGILAVGMIIFGGVMYILSAGNSGRMESAKKIILYSLLGFTLAVAAPTLLKEMKNLITGGQATPSNFIENAPTTETVVIKFINFLLAAFGALSLIAFVISGISYLISLGASSQSERGKKMIFYSILGVIVASSGIILLKQIMKILNAG